MSVKDLAVLISLEHEKIIAHVNLNKTVWAIELINFDVSVIEAS